MITGHFLDADLPAVDGVVRVARAYRKTMERRLGPSWLVTPRHPDGVPDDPRSVRFFSLPFRPPYRLGVPAVDPLLSRRLAAIPFDVLHAHTPFAAGEVALAHGRRQRRPVVFTLHSRYPDWAIAQYRRQPFTLGVLTADALFRRPRTHRSRLRDHQVVTEDGVRFCVEATQRMVFSYCTRVDCVFVPSEALRRELHAYVDSCSPCERARPVPRMEVVRQGIDFPETARGEFRLRERYAIPPATPVLLFVGQLAYEKEVPFLLEAAARLAASGQEFHLVLVGDGPYRADFEALASHLGVRARCTFVGLVADQRVLADHYAQSDVFAFPSLYETQGLAPMEAASFGLPMIAQRDAPGLSEVFTDGETAVMTERTVEAFATALRALCVDGERRRAVGQRARRVVVRAEQAVEAVVRVYRELSASGAPVPR